jgi:hypothetical protein
MLRDLAARIGDQKYLAGGPCLILLLRHDDPIVRYHAVVSLGFDLRFKAATDALIDILEGDPDTECRDAAAGSLRAIWQNFRERWIMQRLSKAALDNPDENVRKSAYFALIVVNGISDEEYLELLQHDRRPVNPDHAREIVAPTAGEDFLPPRSH